MNASDAKTALENGKRIRPIDSDQNYYIELKNNTLVDSDRIVYGMGGLLTLFFEKIEYELFDEMRTNPNEIPT